MNRLINALKQHAGAMDAMSGQGGWAILTSYNPATHEGKVQFQPTDGPGDTDTESGWLPIKTQSAGPGWGLVTPLSPGMQVYVAPDLADPDSYVILGAAFNVQDQPPTAPSTTGGDASPAQSGELLAKSKAGAVVRLTAAGRMLLQDAHGAAVEFQNNGTILMTGTLHVTGPVIGGYGTGAQIGLMTHTHNQPDDSHGDIEETTDAPNAGS